MLDTLSNRTAFSPLIDFFIAQKEKCKALKTEKPSVFNYICSQFAEHYTSNILVPSEIVLPRKVTNMRMHKCKKKEFISAQAEEPQCHEFPCKLAFP